MERASDRRAFARAWSYLNYNPVAKWTALLAAVAAGALYVALLIVLWLFADEMVYRGQIPAMEQLGPLELQSWDRDWLDTPPGSEETGGDQALLLLRLEGTRSGEKDLAHIKPSDTDEKKLLTPEEQRFLWRIYLLHLLHDHVGGEASMQVLPAFRDLPEIERNAVLKRWQERPDREDTLRVFEPEFRTKLMSGSGLETDEQEILWHAYLLSVFNGWIADDHRKPDIQAADALKDWLYTAGQSREESLADVGSLADRGILSLVVRTHLHGRYYSRPVDLLASWNPWLWRTRAGRFGNSGFYLGALLIAGVVLVLLWALAVYLMHEMAARAVIEATTRLRRAVYHHTFRLGTLAFRALGPSEAVTVFTRHVEAVHEGLYTWIVAMFREPVKFGLLFPI